MWSREALERQIREEPGIVVDIVLEQQGKIEELERRLKLNSTNSSKPPSSDRLGTVRGRKKPPSGRRPGGQPGHKGHFRSPFPRERVDETVEVIPKRCGHCSQALEGRDPNPDRHQTAELPPIQVHVTEYRLHTLTCRNCGRTTAAELPQGVSTRLMGPRLTAATALLSGCFRLSKREVRVLLKDLFSLEVSLGAVSGCEKAMTPALAPVMEEAEDFARGQPEGNMDETGWRQRRKLAWLWALATPDVTVFKVHAKRNRKAMKELLGDFDGVLTSDRYGVYNSFPGRRQLCWAHLIRDFKGFRAMRGKPGNIGKRLQSRAKRIFALWGAVKAGKLSRRKFLRRLPYHKRLVENLLQEGATLPHGTAISRTCRRILKLRKWLWTFADTKGVEPTNNAAERALRPAVLWRKGSFGTHSERGSRFAERILSVRATLKKQPNRDLLGFLTQAYQAALSTA
ncbi:MAG: IS66 family transposase, partial [Terriglobia bacterium]